MTYAEAVSRLADLLANSNVDPESKLYRNAYEAIVAIATKELV